MHLTQQNLEQSIEELCSFLAENPKESRRRKIIMNANVFIETHHPTVPWVPLRRVVSAALSPDLDVTAESVSGQETQRVRHSLRELGYEALASGDPDFDDCFSELSRLLTTSGRTQEDIQKRKTMEQEFWRQESQPALTPQEFVERPEPGAAIEGAVTQVTTNRYEREPRLRDECIAHYSKLRNGLKCECCGFDFEATYGDIGKGFMHIHHIDDLSTGERQVDPTYDLVPVCPNCHAMLHRGAKPARKIEDLKRLMANPG